MMLVSQLQKSSTWCGYILSVLGSLAIVAWNSWYPRVSKELSRPGYNLLSERGPMPMFSVDTMERGSWNGNRTHGLLSRDIEKVAILV